ncbi:hypothetical protein RFI_01282, partial [Reticulomyxa filosa]
QFPTVGLRFLALYEKYIDDGHFSAAPAQINVSWETRFACREVYVAVCNHFGITLDFDTRDDIIEPSVNEAFDGTTNWFGIGHSLRPNDTKHKYSAGSSIHSTQGQPMDEGRGTKGRTTLRETFSEQKSMSSADHHRQQLEKHHKLVVRDFSKPPNIITKTANDVGDHKTDGPRNLSLQSPHATVAKKTKVKPSKISPNSMYTPNLGRTYSQAPASPQKDLPDVQRKRAATIDQPTHDPKYKEVLFCFFFTRKKKIKIINKLSK